MKTQHKAKLNSSDILIRGARVNNLRNIDIDIPRNKFTVITGVSGSGKSSLAFDTLYAEGQRRYVESLSAYARQFLGRMPKPDCESIKGLPPAIAIEQKVNIRNPRSTVGTSTEIYDYMRLLFARIGKTISPVSGKEVKKFRIENVVDHITSLPQDTRYAITSPITIPQGRTLAMQLDVFLKGGYSRLVHNGEFVDIAEMLAQGKIPKSAKGYSLLIDRSTVSNADEDVSRLTESIENAFFEGHGVMHLVLFPKEGAPETESFSNSFEADGINFIEPSDLMFNFNNPYGACPRCEGFGKTMGIDERLVIPNQDLSVFSDCVVPWRGPSLSQWKSDFIRTASKQGFPIHRPYNQLTQEQKDLLWHGDKTVAGINSFFDWVQTQQHKIQYRVMMARYRGKTTCPECHGTRLRKEASYVKINGCSITQLVTMSVADLYQWFNDLKLSAEETAIAQRLLTEIRSRLSFLINVGLEYLTLDRLSNTLSGGESQRINLATSLGSALVGSLYILDEPSIGLHPRDNDRLTKVLKQLQMIGNTVVVVEHDEDIMRAADYLIDIGPAAGRLGGEVVYQGAPRDLGNSTSLTRQYLDGTLSIPVPKKRRRSSQFIEVKGATEHNLKNIDVKFPLGLMTVVTGVSGSGKSTLVRDVLYRSLKRHFDEPADNPGACREVTGDLNRIAAVEFIDQNPIGRSSRSNPATYLKAWDEIRQLFASQQLARQMGFPAGHFSFNAEGGRCEQCKGEGVITIEMQFMADITVPCEECHGKRFKPEILEVQYLGKNIYDVLELTVDEAIEFFGQEDSAQCRRIVARLLPLQQVGLGYIKLGQSSSTLSGGENQRVKLAYYLSNEKAQPTMFIFDEPTTGLHFHDINTLLKSFNRLIEKGHTIIIIEHNLDVIKCADHIIDIGPEGGAQGGNLVVAGTPEQVAACQRSYTGKYLKQKLNRYPKS